MPYSFLISGTSARVVEIHSKLNDTKKSNVDFPFDDGNLSDVVSAADFCFGDSEVGVDVVVKDAPKFFEHSQGVGLAVSMAISFKRLGIEIENIALHGQVGPGGHVFPATGAFLAASAVSKMNSDRETGKIKFLFVSEDDFDEASILSDDFEVIGVRHIKDIRDFLENGTVPDVCAESKKRPQFYGIDMSVLGMCEHTRRGLEIAAAGGHNLMIQGQGDSGLLSMACALWTITPGPRRMDKALEMTAIRSMSGLGVNGLVSYPPFVELRGFESSAEIFGGQLKPRPGLLSLAHGGLLVMREISETSRNKTEVIREALKDGVITYARGLTFIRYPTKPLAVFIEYTCPCKRLGHAFLKCDCKAKEYMKHKSKISSATSGIVQMRIQPRSRAFDATDLESSRTVAGRVLMARDIQRHKHGELTSEIKSSDLSTFHYEQWMYDLLSQTKINNRSEMDNVVRVAMTIASLNARTRIVKSDVVESMSYATKLEPSNADT